MDSVLGLLCVAGIVLVLGVGVVLTLYSVAELRRMMGRMIDKVHGS